VHFGAIDIETRAGQHFFHAQVFPGALNPDEFKVELYTDQNLEGRPAIQAMTSCKTCGDSSGGLVFATQVSATRSSTDYTPRIIPFHPNASVPLEAGYILWQR
jgi:starch phosphorylase